VKLYSTSLALYKYTKWHKVSHFVITQITVTPKSANLIILLNDYLNVEQFRRGLESRFAGLGLDSSPTLVRLGLDSDSIPAGLGLRLDSDSIPAGLRLRRTRT